MAERLLCVNDPPAGLALWLIPTSPTQASSLLQDEINTLTSRTSGASAPFEPHATLLSGLDVERDGSAQEVWEVFLEALRSWKQQRLEEDDSKAIVCSLRPPTTRGFYFQCLVLPLEPTAELVSLNQAVAAAFDARRASLDTDQGTKARPPYFPHVSLLYADLSVDEAQTEIARMQERGEWSRLAEDLSQGEESRIEFRGSSSRAIEEVGFGRIELWNCTGPVSEWKRCLPGIDL